MLDKEDGEVVTSHTHREVSNQARAMNLKPEHNLQKGLKQILNLSRTLFSFTSQDTMRMEKLWRRLSCWLVTRIKLRTVTIEY